MTDDDPITRADLTRELHYMQTQVEQHGFPGTRAVLAELERLHAEGAKQRAQVERLCDALTVAHDAMVHRPPDSELFRIAIREVEAALGAHPEYEDEY